MSGVERPKCHKHSGKSLLNLVTYQVKQFLQFLSLQQHFVLLFDSQFVVVLKMGQLTHANIKASNEVLILLRFLDAHIEIQILTRVVPVHYRMHHYGLVVEEVNEARELVNTYHTALNNAIFQTILGCVEIFLWLIFEVLFIILDYKRHEHVIHLSNCLGI